MTSVDNSAAFDGSGGFVVDQSFPLFSTVDSILTHNLTQAVQLRYSTRDLNYKIGVVTDICGNYLTSRHSSVDGDLIVDNLTIETPDFLNNLTLTNVIQVGQLSKLYSDFIYTLETYFGGTITVGGQIFNVNNGVFDKNALINICNGHNFNVHGSIVTDLSGSSSLTDINNKLQKAISTNPFGNRTANTRIRDGFLDGDIILIPDGITISLSIDINPGPGNTTGVDTLLTVDNSLNYVDTATKVKKITTYTTTNITQTYTVPIAFILSNDGNFAFSSFSQSWSERTALNGFDWNSVSLSSDGQKQTAVDILGRIYLSKDYGVNWSLTRTINPASNCCVAMSFDGKYITASDGSNIYISHNSGTTWSAAFAVNSTDIFLNISLSGKYQSFVSAGDGFYQSSDYGFSWTKFDDNSDLANSIKTFPISDITLSFTGQYQSIAAEHIYYSHDYGVTWTNSSGTDPANLWSDQNWIGITSNTVGDIQYAIVDNGYVYKSTNYGVSWAVVQHANLPPKHYRDVVCNATGEYVTIIDDLGNIIYSSDTGSTWTVTTISGTSNNYKSIAMAANIRYQLIVSQQDPNNASVYGSLYYSKLE